MQCFYLRLDRAPLWNSLQVWAARMPTANACVLKDLNHWEDAVLQKNHMNVIPLQKNDADFKAQQKDP